MAYATVKASDLVQKCYQPLNEHWGYIWGATGQVWTQSQQTKAVENKGTNWEQTKEYGSKWIGQRVLDCSGLLYWGFKQLGGYMYHGADTIWRKWTTQKGNVTASTVLRPGTAVFMFNGKKRNHVGIYVGDGMCIEAKGTRWGVVKSKLSTWNEWGELKGVDYDLGANDPIAYEATIASSNVAADTALQKDVTNTTLRRGDSGAEVKTLQQTLNDKGFDCGEVDGVFGKKTRAAVEAFQQANGLKVDGICGPMTWGALKADAPKQEVEEQQSAATEAPVTLKKAMLSQPMAGKTDAEIVATRERAVAALQQKGFEVVNTLFTDDYYSDKAMQERGVVQIPICFLAKSLENMSLCHAAYFCAGWENARGCRIEHEVALAYGVEIIYEDESSAPCG